MSVQTRHVCRSCQAPIVWAITSKGERMPIDLDPVAGGNIRLTAGVVMRAELVGSTIDIFDPDDDGVRYVSHFATCPQADEWRNS